MTTTRDLEGDLLFIDFDGVLAIPYDPKETLYPQISEVLTDLKNRGALLFVVSFNPIAHEALTRWNVAHLFQAMRCGSVHGWHEPEGATYKESYSESLRHDMTKSKQIQALLSLHVNDKNIAHRRIIFFDDDINNINHVQDQMNHVECIHIDMTKGLTLEVYPQ